jgi:hypothetical protein
LGFATAAASPAVAFSAEFWSNAAAFSFSREANR